MHSCCNVAAQRRSGAAAHSRKTPAKISKSAAQLRLTRAKLPPKFPKAQRINIAQQQLDIAQQQLSSS